MISKTIMYLAAGAIIILAGIGVSGCSIADIVHMDVPQSVRQGFAQDGVQIRPRVSLAEGRNLVNEWNILGQRIAEDHLRAGDQLLNKVDDAMFVEGILSSFSMTGLQMGEGIIKNAFPGGAAAISLVGIFGALAAGKRMKRPGEDAEVAYEKESSFNKGREVGSEIVMNALSVMGIAFDEAAVRSQMVAANEETQD